MTLPEPPIVWTDLNDDCTAHWCGLVLRAEQMTRRDWWWAVFTTSAMCEQIGTSCMARNGQQARAAAEAVARAWMARKHHRQVAASPHRRARSASHSPATRPITAEGGPYPSAAALRWWMRAARRRDT